MASETVVAVFHSLTHAEAAISDLVAAGVPAASIQHYARDASEPGGEAPVSGGVAPQHRHGFWAWLTGEENNNEHHAAYDRSIESGRTVVTVVGDTSTVEQVYSILERHDPLDLEEHGHPGAASEGTGTGAGRGGMVRGRTGEMVAEDGLAGGTTGTATAATTMETGAATGRANFEPRIASATDTTRTGATDEVMSLSEETLQVGKREVNRGTTRIRRYVVERPVEEQIRLRDETVSVFRRPAPGGATVGADAFKDREISVTETDEEAVVGKSAHVVEEVVVQKGVQDRVETIRDTLRHEEVEIDGPASAAGAAARPKPAL